MNQNYGVLRVVRVRPPVTATNLQDKYPSGWLPEERLVHLLSRRETTIGRALSNDIILMDSTVSREHACLMLDEDGWHVVNLTMQNVVRVNGRPVPAGSRFTMHTQDILVLGSTMLQLIAPQSDALKKSADGDDSMLHLASHGNGTRDVLSELHTLTEKVDGSLTLPPLEQAWQKRVTPPSLPRMPALNAPGPTSDESEPEAPVWEEEENVLGPGVTLQFALPQRMTVRTRWLIAGVGITILMVSVIVTIVLNTVIGINAWTRSGPASVVMALTIPLIPAIGINLLVNFIDRFEREPWFLRLAAFLWGAVIAIPPAFLIEQNLDDIIHGLETSNLARAILQGLNAGVTEETVKGLGLLLLFLVLRDQFDNVTDGIVYGALIGAGFAMVENIVYFARNPGFIVYLIVGRIMLGWLCHSTFTVCFGAALGYIRHTRVRWRHIVIPLIGYLVAVGLHSVFDFINFYANYAVLNNPNNTTVSLFSLIAIIGDYIPPFIAQIVLLYILIKALAHEAAVIREFLADEVSKGIVKVDEYALLQNSFLRARDERRVLFRNGIKPWLRVKALYQTEIGLAFRKWHVSMGDKPKLGYRQPEDAYRQRIKRLRREILADDKRKQATTE